MTPILFLDFDGVLNSGRFFAERDGHDGSKAIIAIKRSPRSRPSDDLDPRAVARLNEVVRRTGCVVVVSSSWRYAYSTKQLASILRERGFIGRVVGATQCPSADWRGTRGDEIAQWLGAFGHGLRFAVVDDQTDMGPVAQFFVQTTFDVGITDEHVEALVALLGEPARTAGGGS